MTDIVIKFVEEVGQNSVAYTNLSRRTEVTFHDVAQAFSLGGIELDALYKWEESSDEVPFNTDIPSIPLRRNVSLCGLSSMKKIEDVAKQMGSSAAVSASSQLTTEPESQLEYTKIDPIAASAGSSQEGSMKLDLSEIDGSQGALTSAAVTAAAAAAAAAAPLLLANNRDHIPDFLPPFPDKHTYKFTAMFPKRNEDVNTKRKLHIKQKRQVESSLVKLDQAGKIPQKADEVPFERSIKRPRTDQ
eukprot:TRINITY_DN10185_c1_g1_i2.p3 TRINITY_DN10185_c1_g1~~TRINITY_DN10185_c1_g1_i2.p3  ORF type:complete len:285 (-),score=89.01 TRINITY_DN10185_c1_g1_i2:1918-2652(-)